LASHPTAPVAQGLDPSPRTPQPLYASRGISKGVVTVCLSGPLSLSLSGILVAHFLQTITPCLALGGELVYHRRPGEEGAVLSLAGRYTASNWIATLTLGQAGAHATYYHKASEQVHTLSLSLSRSVSLSISLFLLSLCLALY
uniref:Uncharacterized protein n=1 Tax=Callorhinchus milii TaxID=7868 RepID=A0A4W3GI37_CALMI